MYATHSCILFHPHSNKRLIHQILTHYCRHSLISPFVTTVSITTHHFSPYLVTVRRSIREDVLKMESTLLTLTVQIRTIQSSLQQPFKQSSREEWMDTRISIEVGQTMFRASVQSEVSSGWVWRRSTGGLYITFF